MRERIKSAVFTFPVVAEILAMVNFTPNFSVEEEKVLPIPKPTNYGNWVLGGGQIKFNYSSPNKVTDLVVTGFEGELKEYSGEVKGDFLYIHMLLALTQDNYSRTHDLTYRAKWNSVEDVKLGKMTNVVSVGYDGDMTSITTTVNSQFTKLPQ